MLFTGTILDTNNPAHCTQYLCTYEYTDKKSCNITFVPNDGNDVDWIKTCITSDVVKCDWSPSICYPPRSYGANGKNCPVRTCSSGPMIIGACGGLILIVIGIGIVVIETGEITSRKKRAEKEKTKKN